MDWKPYLESIGQYSRYAIGRQCYTPLDVLDRRPGAQVEAPFLLDLQVRAAAEQEQNKVERLGVLEGLRRYAAEHVLLAGRPGSGKTTALQRLLLEEAEQALRNANTRIPVLLESRHHQGSTLDLMRLALKEHGVFMESPSLEALLQERRLLLLVDGINELSSEAARRDLETFRRGYRATTPMIFTSRELAAGGDLGIDKRLEMEPLTESQMQRFVRAYLGEDGNRLLRQLQGRLRELAQVPLLLWMLCSLFWETQERLPENLGLALRQFTKLYDCRLKGDVPVSEESRRWWPRLLQRLAFIMLQGPEPKELYVAIPGSQAEDWLTEYLQEEKFDRPRDRAMAWLQDLLNHHLLQRSAGDSIEFRHQFIQEYYAAEYLLHRLPKLNDVALQCDYLNYLKWTEPLILMLGLIEDRDQALRVVRLAAEVDWLLAARLAGAVRSDFQQEAVNFIATLQIPEWFRMWLIGTTQSRCTIPLINQALCHQDRQVRCTAAWALGNIGGEAEISALRSALHDADSGVRRAAACALGDIGGEAAVNALLDALHDKGSFDSFLVREAAVWALGNIGGKAAIRTLLDALHDKGSSFLVREAAAKALGNIGGETAVNALLSVSYDDYDYGVRRIVAEALGKAGGETAVNALLDALQDKDSWVRRTAAEALGKVGGEAAVSALLDALRDENSRVRGAAAGALGEVGREVVVNVLLDALHDEDAWVRGAAAKALGEIGGEAALSALLDTLHDEDVWVRGAAARALGEIGGEAALSALLDAFDQDSEVRGDAVEALGKVGGEAALSALLDALHDEYFWVREAAAEALGKVGGEAAVNTLLDAFLHDADSEVGEAAARALGKVGGEAAVNALLDALHDEDVWVRQTAAEVLSNIGSEGAINTLLDALRHKDSWVRWTAAKALGNIGGEAAVKALLDALHDEDSWVRETAAGALHKIGNTQLLSSLTTDFRQGVQTDFILQVIIALQEHFRIYRPDILPLASTEAKNPPFEKSMQQLRVVLASPSDVQPERDVLPGVIEELNRVLGAVLNVDLKLYRWETDAYPGFHPEGPQGLIDPILRIEHCDILIGIFWKRFGTPTKDAGSGTEHEFRTAYEAWKQNKRPQMMVYFKEAPYFPKSREETDQWGKVLDFKTDFPKQGLWWPFTETGEFENLVRRHLSGWLRDNFKP